MCVFIRVLGSAGHALENLEEEFRGCNSYDSVMMAIGAPGMTFRIPVVDFYAFSEGDVESSTHGYEEERVDLIMCVGPRRIDDDG